MSEINDQSSDTSSDLNWPLDHSLEHVQHDRVIFENVADQYVKGEDVTAFFTLQADINVNPEADQIGLLRVGYTNVKECLAYASVQFNPSTSAGSTHHGIATFPSASLPVTDDEFYQFCYILNKTKNLGSSIPFQLNCALDDIDLLSNVPIGKTKPDSLIALADNDNDDVVIIHTKRMLTEEKLRQENRHLFEINHRLETQKDECQTKLELLEIKTKEHINKIDNDMKNLTTSHKTAIDELTSRQQAELKLRAEYDACRSLCEQYQQDSIQLVERCRILEIANSQSTNDTNQLRSQLAITAQLAKDQATQIIDLERRLMQSNELIKTSNQRQTLLEQQIRDLRLTTEKHQLSIIPELEVTKKRIAQQNEQMNLLETENTSLKNEISSLKVDNELLAAMSEKDKEIAGELKLQLYQLGEEHAQENVTVRNEIEKYQKELNEMHSIEQAYKALKVSYSEIEKRCVKHQKSELEAKRQLSAYNEFVNELQNEIHELKERLSVGAEEYKTIYRKYSLLERTNQEQELPPPPATTTTTAAAVTTQISIEEPVANDDELRELLTTAYDNLPQQNELFTAAYDNPQQQRQNELENIEPTSQRSSLANVDDEVRQCPMCYWQFPTNMTPEGKREHIEHHFD